MIKKEASLRLGSNIELTPDEQKGSNLSFFSKVF